MSGLYEALGRMFYENAGDIHAALDLDARVGRETGFTARPERLDEIRRQTTKIVNMIAAEELK